MTKGGRESDRGVIFHHFINFFSASSWPNLYRFFTFCLLTLLFISLKPSLKIIIHIPGLGLACSSFCFYSLLKKRDERTCTLYLSEVECCQNPSNLANENRFVELTRKVRKPLVANRCVF